PAASHLSLAHLLWEQTVTLGDTVVDMTSGNGHDALRMARLALSADGARGKLIALDVQPTAIESTRSLLERELGADAIERAGTFVVGNNRDVEALGVAAGSAALVSYNLGYLPGGDKSVFTRAEDTLASLNGALQLLKPGGMLSIACYVGHAEGVAEMVAVKQFAAHLDAAVWRAFVHERLNYPPAPLLVTVLRMR
ncbi:unnamed protein product, partial [Phaeothamnion confervicola]